MAENMLGISGDQMRHFVEQRGEKVYRQFGASKVNPL